MSNVGNEHGQVLNSVLTTGEGAGLDDLCQGLDDLGLMTCTIVPIVQWYRDAGEPQPDAIYVDRDCCSDRGELPVICVDVFCHLRQLVTVKIIIINNN